MKPSIREAFEASNHSHSVKNVSSPARAGARAVKSLLLAFGFSVAAACAGELENIPSAGGQGGGAGVGGGAAGTTTTAGNTGDPVCDMVIARLTSTQALAPVGCATEACHHPANTYVTARGGLSLLPDPVAAMRGKLATYVDVTNPQNCPPTPEVLLDPENLEASLFIKKIRNTHSCGLQMPSLAPYFTAAEVTCMENWARSIPP